MDNCQTINLTTLTSGPGAVHEYTIFPFAALTALGAAATPANSDRIWLATGTIHKIEVNSDLAVQVAIFDNRPVDAGGAGTGTYIRKYIDYANGGTPDVIVAENFLYFSGVSLMTTLADRGAAAYLPLPNIAPTTLGRFIAPANTQVRYEGALQCLSGMAIQVNTDSGTATGPAITLDITVSLRSTGADARRFLNSQLFRTGAAGTAPDFT